MYRLSLCLFAFLQLFVFVLCLSNSLQAHSSPPQFFSLEFILHQIILFSITLGAIYVLLIPRHWPFSQYTSKSPAAIIKSVTSCLIHNLRAGLNIYHPSHSPRRREFWTAEPSYLTAYWTSCLRSPIDTSNIKCKKIIIVTNIFLSILCARNHAKCFICICPFCHSHIGLPYFPLYKWRKQTIEGDTEASKSSFVLYR